MFEWLHKERTIKLRLPSVKPPKQLKVGTPVAEFIKDFNNKPHGWKLRKTHYHFGGYSGTFNLSKGFNGISVTYHHDSDGESTMVVSGFNITDDETQALKPVIQSFIKRFERAKRFRILGQERAEQSNRIKVARQLGLIK